VAGGMAAEKGKERGEKELVVFNAKVYTRRGIRAKEKGREAVSPTTSGEDLRRRKKNDGGAHGSKPHNPSPGDSKKRKKRDIARTQGGAR